MIVGGRLPVWDSTACCAYVFETHSQKFKYVFQLRLVRLHCVEQCKLSARVFAIGLQAEEQEKVLANTYKCVYVDVPTTLS